MRPSNSDWKKKRLNQLVSTAQALQGRILGAFGNDDELREIGRITLQFADLEDSISLICEVLLMRPELRGFHTPKAVLQQFFTMKVDLLNKLTIAIGVLRSIDSGALEKAIENAKQTGELRNTIIHGCLNKRGDGTVVFQNKENEFAAELGALRLLSGKILQANEKLTAAFVTFYGELMELEPSAVEVERPMLQFLNSRLKLLESTIKLLTSKAVAEECQKDLDATKKKVRSSQASAREAKKRLKKSAELRSSSDGA